MLISILKWMIAVLYIIITLVPTLIHSGCYQKQLCCLGRNLTCITVEDGLSHLPMMLHPPHPLRRRKAQGHRRHPAAVYDTKMNRIGKLVLPDLVALNNAGLETIKNRGNRLSTDYLNDEGDLVELPTTTTTTPAVNYHQLIFGEPFYSRDQQPEITRYYRHHKLIRYSLLNQLLPLIVKDSRGNIVPYKSPDASKIAFLEKTAHDNLCYCDEKCITFGDCCSDYTFVCPPIDCAVTEWCSWSDCIPDQGNCGIGVRTRERVIERKAERGGMECPPLVEKMSCFKECHRQKQQQQQQPSRTFHFFGYSFYEKCVLAHLEEITTVALILDYSYNKTREKLASHNIYSDTVGKRKKLLYYCVIYKLGWVNRNCIDKKITAKLYTGNSICTECQPEAQMHRNTATCASDLNDGEIGFWKLIGPKSCNGIWRRISRTDNCRCEVNFSELDAFLLV